MIGLDMTSMDDYIIQWAKQLDSILHPEIIYFVHVEKDFEQMSYLPDELSDIKALDEQVLENMQQAVHAHFPITSKNIQFEAIEGRPFDGLLHWADVKQIDFFIAGKKKTTDGTGILPHLLSRKLDCPVLFIPEIAQRDLKRALIPIDFSEHSKLAVKAALHLKTLVPSLELTCLHVFRVPLGYYKTGKSYEEFGKIMADNAQKQFKMFIKGLASDLACIYRLQSDANNPILAETAQKEHTDIVFVGSKGQTNSAILLLGSCTEKLIQTNDSSLVWVVKKKGENIGFFKAIMDMS